MPRKFSPSVRFAVWCHENNHIRLYRACSTYWRVRNFLLWDVWEPVRWRLISKPYWWLKKKLFKCRQHDYPFITVAGYSFCFMCQLDDARRRREVDKLYGRLPS